MEEEKVEYVPVNVKFKIVSFDSITGSWRDCYAIHNIAIDPIVSVKNVFLKGELYTKIESNDGMKYYSPTELKIIQDHLDILPYKCFGEKKQTLSEWAKDVIKK